MRRKSSYKIQILPQFWKFNVQRLRNWKVFRPSWTKPRSYRTWKVNVPIGTLMQYSKFTFALGATKYQDHFPEKTHINALLFESPRLLAKYLLFLDSHADEYLAYFWWHKYYTVNQNHWMVRRYQNYKTFNLSNNDLSRFRLPLEFATFVKDSTQTHRSNHTPISGNGILRTLMAPIFAKRRDPIVGLLLLNTKLCHTCIIYLLCSFLLSLWS